MEKISKKLIILVIASNSDFYNEVVKIFWKKLIKNCNQNYKNVKIYLLYGDSYNKELNINNENLLCFDLEENLIPNILKKTCLAFEYIKNKYDFEYVFRTNLSSFLIIDRFLNYLDNIKNNNRYLYSGTIVKKKYLDFVSGAGILLNKNSIEIILKNTDKINFSLADDIAIATLLKGIERVNINRYNIEKYNYTLDEDKISLHYENILKNDYFHIRIKNASKENNDTLRWNDLKIFEFFTNKIIP